MSIPVVVIGFILLVPSILGILFGGLMLFGSAAAGPAAATSGEREVRTRLSAQRIPDRIIEDVVASNPIDDSRLVGLTPQQQSAVHEAQMTSSVNKIGAGAGTACGVGFALLMIVGSFVGGLLGWLLIMRKRVLQCARCGAVVAAS
jgi:hypothetical protein